VLANSYDTITAVINQISVYSPHVSDSRSHFFVSAEIYPVPILQLKRLFEMAERTLIICRPEITFTSRTSSILFLSMHGSVSIMKSGGIVVTGSINEILSCDVDTGGGGS
jgi:hypothetical protein